MGKFLEVKKVKIGSNKNVVVSINNGDKISIVQQLEVPDGDKIINVYMKYAIETDLEGLKDIHKMIGNAITDIENMKN